MTTRQFNSLANDTLEIRRTFPFVSFCLIDLVEETFTLLNRLVGVGFASEWIPTDLLAMLSCERISLPS